MPENVVEFEPRKLLQRDFRQSEFANARMSVSLPVGWTFEDTLKPEFWVNVAHLFHKQPHTNEPDKAGAVIEIRTEDHAFYAELYVRAVQERGFIVATLREPVYFGPKKTAVPGFKTRWNVGARGYDIIRLSDKEIVGHAADFKVKEHALAWIEDTIAAMKG
jgi:hypothetical protein